MGCTRAVASLRVFVFAAGLFTVGLGAGCSSRAPVAIEQTGTTSQDVVTNLALFATGVDNSNAQLAINVSDPHYTITATTDATRPAPRNAITSTFNPAWVNPGSTSRWLSLDSGTCTTCAVATYDYTTTFSMPASANPATAKITANVASDDQVAVFLNGTQVTTGTGFGATQALTIGPNQAAFTAGTNTLTFRVTNSGGGPTGLLITSISGTASDCTADSMCTSSQFCYTNAQTCLAKLANGTAIPNISGHTPPLVGACNVGVGPAVCASGVCDSDNACGLANGSSTACSAAAQCRSNVCDTDARCGFANGDGPCTSGNAGTVCRSGTCGAVSLVCVPSGGSGCASDADCNTATQFCNGSTFTCTAKLANGTALVNPDPLHANGTCVARFSAQCSSGACDSDNICGVANGDPCLSSTVCRSGTCGATSLVCVPSGGCAVDTDCAGARYCNTPTGACTDRVANGGMIPVVTGHTPPINGTCSPTTAVIVCASGACDGTVCGVNLGDGTCVDTSQCNSGVCVSTGLNTGKCEPCVADGTCTGGTPACNTTTNQCVTCTAGNGSACSGPTPVCNVLANTCAACNGDNGTAATLACPTAANPYCTCGGACGKCTGNADCVGLHAGLICDTATGACGSACSIDADCSGQQWCNNPTAAPFAGTCAAKVANGQPVPAGAPINGTCTAPVGARVGVSGVCSTADNLCGEPNGVG